MVRHLRDGDEAFLVSFAHNVAFEEDLTGNAKLLEQAMDQIRPASGTALFDAVAFAAGHLNRIARNRKRVLLVVSDGQNETSQISPLELAHELKIGDVEIFCIGIKLQYRGGPISAGIAGGQDGRSGAVCSKRHAVSHCGEPGGRQSGYWNEIEQTRDLGHRRTSAVRIP
jgi:hypothetical protein